jgi:hypothetical protein
VRSATCTTECCVLFFAQPGHQQIASTLAQCATPIAALVHQAAVCCSRGCGRLLPVLQRRASRCPRHWPSWTRS